MESSKLKNIVLVILIVTNILLLLLLGSRRIQQSQADEQTIRDAVELLAQKGIAVQPDVLPRGSFAPLMEVERDAAWEQTVFTALLGEDTRLTQRGLVSYYTGTNGQADVRGDGTFSVALTPGAFPLGELDMASHGLSVLETLGYPAQVTEARENSLTVLECCVLSDGGRAPIFSCSAALTYADGSLVSIEGHRLVGQPAKSNDSESPLSLATLLTRFRAGIIESGDACSAITGATQGYLLSTGSNGALRLTPVLRMVTDAGSYYVGALNGGVSRG